MNGALLVARREFYGYFRSPLAATVIAAALLIDGIYFYWKGLSERTLSAVALAEFIFIAGGTAFLAGLVLAMRLIAEERQTKSITLINTSPLKDSQIVAGKFGSAILMVLLKTALTIYMPLLLFVNGKVSVGHIVVGYLGILLYGAAGTAIGFFGSALARSQVVAIIVGLAISGALVLMWMVAKAADPPINSVLSGLAIHHDNYTPFMVGRLELRCVVYYVAVIWFFLLASTKVLEARRWR
jgi:ABC-2 type transport system permease protein